MLEPRNIIVVENQVLTYVESYISRILYKTSEEVEDLTNLLGN